MSSKNRFYNKGEKKRRKKKDKRKDVQHKKQNVIKHEETGRSKTENTTTTEEAVRITIPELPELEKEVKRYIIGQDYQVRQIITGIYRSLLFPTIKSNILIIGNSGTGKTATIKQIAQLLDLPCTIEDATKYTQEGYYGADTVEMIYNLMESAGNDIIKAYYGIIVIDEIDKKASNGEQHDVAGVEVLKSLLKIIEGTVVMIPPKDFNDMLIPFDTSNLIFIFMGAFPGLNKIRDLRLNRNSLGFGITNKPEENGEQHYLKQDLVKYGLPEEFVGRLDTIIEMNNLGRQELIQILKKSRLSIFRKYEIELRRIGVKLDYDDTIFEEIANSSLTLDTGARELSNTVNHIFEAIIYEVLSNPGKYSKCKILPGIVENNKRFELS